MARSLTKIGWEIKRCWKNPYFGAIPYIDAMLQLNSIEDKYFQDDAKSIVLYFLANANSFRGEDARRIKKELKEMAGVK